MRLARSLSLILAASQLVGCQTTGDPTQGGIFWSETKAKQRLRDKEDTLDAINADTSRVNRQNSRLQNSAARKRQFMGE